LLLKRLLARVANSISATIQVAYKLLAFWFMTNFWKKV